MNATDPALQPWVSSATATSLITNGQTGVVSFDVTEDAAAILAGSYAGHGWLIKKVEENQNGSLEFASREQGSGPRLLLEIDGAPGGGGGGLGPVVGSATVSPSADTHLRQGQPNQNFGADPVLRIQSSGRNRALFDFEATAVTSALQGALVRARLVLPIAETADNWGPDRAVGAHRLRQSWSELGATWSCATDSNPANSSVDCSGTSAWVMFGAGTELPWIDPPTGTTLVSSGQTGALELDVTRDVACALAGFSPLDGWMVKKELESQNGKIELRSRETSTPPGLLLEWTNGNGVVVTAGDCNAVQPPPNGCTPSAPLDTTCNGTDDDCDGLTDDDFSVTVTSCGTGACASTGGTSCIAGQVVDSCAPITPAPNDSVCNGLDDDCNGVVDEDFSGVPTSCGIGACTASGLTECVLGEVLDVCQPESPAPSDATCDGIDDDCDGQVDEHFTSTPTACGVGVCAATGATSCIGGNVVDSCIPTSGSATDTICNGLDDDCDSIVDEEYVSIATSCGIGACSAAGSTECVLGEVVDSCHPGTPAASDATCNGVDDDCSGTADEDYVASTTSCGVGGCSAQGTQQCVNGQEADSCAPGTPAPADATCDGVDEDCSGTADEDYAGSLTTCGIGACFATAVTTCEQGHVVDHCQAGTPASSDASCNGIDDDCDGTPDEDFVLTCAGASVQHCVNGALSPTDCSDSNPCNGAEGCSGGACQPGVPPDLADGNPCTEDTCDAASGVQHTPLPEGSECGDYAECDPNALCVSFLPPDPAEVAPDLPGGNVSLLDRMRFLFEGDPPIQTGVAPGTIQAGTVAVLRGRVLDQAGEPLPNVSISIHTHPEFGQTVSRLDGNFDLVLNGGGLFTVEYTREGYFVAQRTLRVPWQDFAAVDDVVLVQADPLATVMEFPSAAPQLHRGTQISDVDGARVATLHVNPGTEAQLRLPDGSSTSVSSLTIRATEYTVGELGPAAMPAELPATSGYTYAVELSADEAELAGAQQVEFSQPLAFFVDNFLQFPTGAVVPVGTYDRAAARWVGEPNGRVIAILSVTAGLADLDVDGSGTAANAATLTAFGITAAERQSLAGLYAPGTSIWRFALLHFSTWDGNHPIVAEMGQGGEPPASPTAEAPLDQPKTQCGSIIEIDNQILGERLAIAGTPFTFNYRSDRVIGRAVDRSIVIPVTGASVSDTHLGSVVRVAIAGQFHSVGGFSSEPNQSFTFTWDGRDREGRAIHGRQPALVSVGQTFPARYARSGETGVAFGRTGNGSASLMGPGRLNYITFYTHYELSIGAYDNRQQGLGGWSLSVHHTYDPVTRMLYRGDGTRHGTNSISDTIERFAGVPHTTLQQNSGDGGPALDATINETRGLAVGPDGAVYVGTRFSLRRIDPVTKIITTIAGGKDTQNCNASLINGPPGDMCLYPRKLDFGPEGALYMSDNPIGGGTIDRIRKLDLRTGLITHVAGRAPGTNCANQGDGGLATNAAICSLISHATGPDGSVYVLDRGPQNTTDVIRKITPNGIIDTVTAMDWAGNDGNAPPPVELRVAAAV